MNSKIFFVIMLFVVGLAVFGLTTKPQSIASVPESNNNQDSLEETYLSKSARMGAVDVEITPEKLKSGEDSIFEVSLNTHSVDLNYDFTSIMTLSDDRGNVYNATEWIGGSGGHHLSGTIGFEKLSQGVDSLTLKINGIDNVVHSFVWQL